MIPRGLAVAVHCSMWSAHLIQTNKQTVMLTRLIADIKCSISLEYGVRKKQSERIKKQDDNLEHFGITRFGNTVYLSFHGIVGEWKKRGVQRRNNSLRMATVFPRKEVGQIDESGFRTTTNSVFS